MDRDMAKPNQNTIEKQLNSISELQKLKSN